MSQILYWSLLILVTSVIPADPTGPGRLFHTFSGKWKEAFPTDPDSLQHHEGPWAYECGNCSRHLSLAAPQTATRQPPHEPRGVHTVFGKTRPKEQASTFPLSWLFTVWSKNSDYSQSMVQKRDLLGLWVGSHVSMARYTPHPRERTLK